MTGLLVKQRVGSQMAVVFLIQAGNQKGLELGAAVRLPLKKGAKMQPANEQEATDRADRLDLHIGWIWARWRGEWVGEERFPYAGVTWQMKNGWRTTAEIADRKKQFLKPSWMIAVHPPIGRDWQVVVGLHQSGLSDRPYPFIGAGVGIGGMFK